MWRTRCRYLLSDDILGSIERGDRWSHEESLHLRELYLQTNLSSPDIALHFPSRNRAAVSIKISRLQLPSAKKQKTALLKNEASGPTAVITPVATPVTHQKPRQALGGLGQRRMFSSSSYALSKYWSAEEDRKLLELQQQGSTHRDIAKMLEGRTIPSVRSRLNVLRVGLTAPKRGKWTLLEDATILEKRRQGLTYPEISRYLPERRLDSIIHRAKVLHLEEEMGRNPAKSLRPTSDEIQHVIQIRTNERKTLREIATQLGRSYEDTQHVWSYYCSPLLSKKALRAIYAASKNSWTTNEVNHLIKIYNRGKLPQKEMALHFPSRTLGALRSKVEAMKEKSLTGWKLSKTREPKHASPRQSRKPSSPRGLQSTRPTLSMPDSIGSTSRRAFSSSSRASLKAKAKIWTQDEDQKILELYRQGLAASRIAASFGDDISPAHVERRLRVLRLGKPAARSREILKWTRAEDALVSQMKQDGLRSEDIAAQLPGRTASAVRNRWNNRLLQRARDSRQVEPLPLTKPRTAWSDVELQRMIDMRVKERKSFIDIARDLGRSIVSVKSAWARGAAHLPHETLQELWVRSNWTSDETKRLIQLWEKGVPRKDIALQFPSKTLSGVGKKMTRLYLRYKRTRKNRNMSITESDWIALKAALEPHLDEKPEGLIRIHTAFPQFSSRQVTDTLYRMRFKRSRNTETEQSDNDSVRVKDE